MPTVSKPQRADCARRFAMWDFCKTLADLAHSSQSERAEQDESNKSQNALRGLLQEHILSSN